MTSERLRTALVLSAFAVVFTGLCVSSYLQKSATADEPVNLTAGYTMLRLHDYRIHPENLPLLRLWTAVPLLLLPDVKLDTNRASWKQDDRVTFAFEFLYRDNDADRLINRARFMVVLLGLGLGCLIFFWARDWFGMPTATITLALYATEPNILAHSGIASMDIGISFLIFGTFYFVWRLTQKYSAGNLLGLAAFFALAMVSKFTSWMLVPLIALLLGLGAWRNQTWLTRSVSWLRRVALATGIMIGLLILAYGAIWAVYDFRYLPKADRCTPFRFADSPSLRAGAPYLAVALSWIDAHRLLPNACTQGLALEQAHGQIWPSYLLGTTSVTGWWYYFPFAILIKTPVTLLFLAVTGICLAGRATGQFLVRGLFILLPLLAGLAAGMTAHMNIGLRHVLPLYPFLLMTAAYPIAELIRQRRRIPQLFLGGLCLFQFTETALAYPDYLAFFNPLVGGPRQGHKYLADSNLDWGQDLTTLKHWLDANHLDHIQLSFFGMADPAYYGIHATYLPGSPFFGNPHALRPAVPGFVAVSVHNLVGANPGLPRPDFYEPLRDLKPIAELGHSIHVYWVDHQLW